MTLKLMQGFETVVTDGDVRLQGWVHPSTGSVVGIPSITASAGTSLKLLSPYAGAAVNPGVAAQNDYGWYPLGLTVNQAWLAGGFSFGCAARFNGTNALTIAPNVLTYATPQLAFDGTYYWAIGFANSAYSVAYSSNLQSWTTVTIPNQVALTASTMGSLQYVGNGTIAMTATCYSSTTALLITTVYTTSNLGVTWTATVINPAYPSYAIMSNYGNATTPSVLFATQGTVAQDGIYVGTIGGTYTLVAFPISPIVGISWSGVINGYIVAVDYGGYIYYAPTTANLALTASWSYTRPNVYYQRGITYFKSAWYVATSNGVYTTTVVQPVSGTAWTSVSSSIFQWLVTNGTTMVANIANAGLYTSTNGTTWTLNTTTSLTGLANIIYDGTYFVASTATSVFKSSDGITWTLVYTPDSAEGTTNTLYSNLGLVAATAVAPATGTFTYNSGFGISMGVITTGNRALNLVYNNVAITLGTVASTLTYSTGLIGYNYFEILCIATATANTFNVYVLLNGGQIGNIQKNLLLGTATTDTISQLIVNLPRAGYFIAVDDIYFLTMTGSNSMPLGPVNIQLLPPSTDVSDQWTKDGAEASNAAAVLATSIASATGYVSTNTAGNKDIYNTAGGISGLVTRVCALKVEAFAATNGSDSVSVGLVSNSVETDGIAVALNPSAYAYVSSIIEKDPNTNGVWTPASANLAKTAIIATSIVARTYATLNPSDKASTATLSNGNLTVLFTTTALGQVRSTIGKSSGQWYWEYTQNITTGPIAGIATAASLTSTWTGADAVSWSYYWNGSKYVNGSGTAYGAQIAAGDIMGVALDMNAGTVTFYHNGVSQGVAFSGLTGTIYAAVGQSGAGTPTFVMNFGATAFTYTPPTGFNAGLY